MSASVQSPVELPSVDARSSAPHMWCSGTRNDRYREVFHEFLVLRSAIISKRVSLGEVFLEKQPDHREKRYIERQNKVHSDEGKWSGPADTRPKQDHTRCRRGVSIEDRDGILFLRHCEPTMGSSSRAEQRTMSIYIRVAVREALSGRTCYLGARKRSDMKGNS